MKKIPPRSRPRLRRFIVTLFFVAGAALATDLTIRLPDNPPITRQRVEYQCDANGPEIGVPAGQFPVEYINAGGNSLIVVPISGNTLIFSNVSSASGARYTTQQYTWWEAKGAVTLSSESMNGRIESSCQRSAWREPTLRR